MLKMECLMKKLEVMMRHELEKYLWDRMGKPYKCEPFVRHIIDEMIKLNMINSPKQAWRTLEKWASKDLYCWGSCLDLGWKTKEKEFQDPSKLQDQSQIDHQQDR